MAPDDLRGLAAFDQFQHERIQPMPFDSKVKLCQELLTAKSYPCVFDGFWGPETRRQLGAFLYEHNLRDNEAPLPAGVKESDLAAIQRAPAWARGIDVAKYQGRVDFAKVKASGVSFVYIKAGGGDDGMYGDSAFVNNASGVKPAGLIHGFYYFHSFEVDPLQQAHHFFRLIGPVEPGDLPPVLDVEDRKTPIKPAAALDHIKACLTELERLFGVAPWLYTSASVLNERRINTKDNGLEKYPLWVPRYETSIASVEKSVPACYPGKRAWKVWQVGFDNDLAGIGPEVDRNFFQGTEEGLRALCVK
jgi:lysozyme